MATIVVFGDTGYTGGHVVREAASRGHRVISVSRSEPQDPVEGVRYAIGNAEQLAPSVVPGADAVVAALSPRGDMAGRLVELYRDLARQAAAAGARYLQVGGFRRRGPLRTRPGKRTGGYRTGGEVALLDAEGTSAISGADFAVAIVDEIENPRHHRAHMGVAY